MNEEIIAQQLADKVAESVTVSAEVVPEIPEVQNFVDKLLPEEQMTRSQLLDHFQVGIDQRHDPLIENYVNTIYEWAREQAGDGNIEQLLRVINAQEQHLGAVLKPDKLRRLGEYVKISKIRQQLAVREANLYNG